MTIFKAALIGTGAIATTHVAALRHAGEQFALCAAVGVDAARTQAFCTEHAIPRAYTDYRAMLTREQPDLVVICTPPASHKELIIASLEAGAWVNCEKPLCASLAELDALQAAEAHTGRFVSTVLQWRSGAMAQHLKAQIASGALGQFLLGTCLTLWYRDAAYHQVAWRGTWRSETGGTVATHGTHLIDLFLWLVADVWQEVTARIATLDRDIEVENVAVATVAFNNGALANIVSSAVSPRQESYLRLDFQKATAEVRALYQYDNTHWQLTPTDGAPDDPAVIAARTPNAAHGGNHVSQLLQLLEHMQRGERPPISLEETRRVMAFTAALYKAAITRQPVQRDSITPDDPFYHAMNGEP